MEIFWLYLRCLCGVDSGLLVIALLVDFGECFLHFRFGGLDSLDFVGPFLAILLMSSISCCLVCLARPPAFGLLLCSQLLPCYSLGQ